MADHEAALAKIQEMFAGKAEEAPVEEAAETEPQEAEAEGKVEGEAPTPPEQPEEQEVEIDGETYLVPKKIADRFIQHADYTRKTQDLAEMRRALSAEREATALERGFHEAVKAETEQLTLLDAQLAQFKKLDWSKIEDTAQLIHLRTQYDQIKDARAELSDAIKAKRGDFESKVKEKALEATQAGQKYIEQHIKGYDDAVKQKLFSYGLSEGYMRDELDRIVDPRIVVTLWKAHQWDALQASKPAIQKRAAQAAPVLKPGATQPQPSRAEQYAKGIKTGKTNLDKVRSAEAYFAEKLGGR